MAQGMTYTGAFGPQYQWGDLGGGTMLTGPAPAATSGGGLFSAVGGLGGVLSIGGAISSAIGSYYSARMAKNSLKHQSKMAQINARVSELGAQSALIQGQRQEQSVRLGTAQMKSAQRTGYAARGIALDSGSAQNVMNSTDFMGEVDALTVQRNALQAAWGHRTQATNYTGQAAMARADASGISPGGSAFTSLLGSAVGVADRWMAYQKVRI